MISRLTPALFSLLIILLLQGCDREHAGATIEEFDGDYRFTGHVGEFFDCAAAEKYYVFNSSENQRLIEEFQKLNLKDGHDAYVRIKGYYKEVQQIDGVDPESEFVPVEFLEFDPTRGCTQGKRKGG